MNNKNTTASSRDKTFGGAEKMEYTINAEGKRLGRVATEIASLLLGKNATNAERHMVSPVTVVVTNARLLDISEKRSQTEFQTYSGYPGGRKVETLEHLAKRRGYGEVVRRVVSGMLPKNKLHKERMKNLVVSE